MRKVCTLLVLAFLLVSYSSFSQEMFIKIATIEGESTLRGHEKEIVVYSYSHGMASCVPTNNSGLNTCKVTVSPLSLMVKFDKSNIALKNAVLMGTHLATADMTFLKTGGDGKPFAYYRIHMENVTVVSTQESGSAGDNSGPAFSVELSFSKIAWEYSSQGSDGRAGEKSTVGWDLTANKAWTYTFPN